MIYFLFIYCVTQGKPVNLPPASPYPTRNDVSKGNAPYQDNYADAHATLKETQQTKQMLQANIDALVRARDEAEIYATLDSLTYG